MKMYCEMRKRLADGQAFNVFLREYKRFHFVNCIDVLLPFWRR